MKCSKNFQNCDYRFMMNVRIQDAFGFVYASLFDDDAVRILGMSAE